jgi:hypothetical protein
MKTVLWKKMLAILFAFVLGITGCSPRTVSEEALSATDLNSGLTITAAPALTETVTPLLSGDDLPVFAAQNIALTAMDLGDGWIMDAEVTDLNASYYFDTSEDGKAIIGTHRTIKTPAFDPAIIESITMRGFSNTQQKMTLFHHVVVFKEVKQAVEANRRFQPDNIDENLPREWTTEHGERYSARAAAIGDQGAFMVGWMDENQPLLKTLEFRKDRVWVGLGSMGQWADLDNFPPVSEKRLEELGRMVEGRIKE